MRYLDQFEQWQIKTAHGPVYVYLSNRRPDGATDEAYLTVWPLPNHLEEDRRGEQAAGKVAD